MKVYLFWIFVLGALLLGLWSQDVPVNKTKGAFRPAPQELVIPAVTGNDCEERRTRALETIAAAEDQKRRIQVYYFIGGR